MLLAMAIFLGACFGAGCYFLGGSAENRRLISEWEEVGKKAREVTSMHIEAIQRRCPR